MKKFYLVFALIIIFNQLSFAQSSNPFASNNVFTFLDTLTNPLRKFNLSTPNNVISISNPNTYFKQSLDFGAPGYLYYLTWNPSYANYLYRIDTATGVTTQITTTALYLPSNMNFGLSWDKTTNKLFTVLGGWFLYSINVYTGSFTFVDTFSTGARITGFAVNNSGSMYGLNSLSSKLVKINKTNGVCTDIGALSFSAGDVSGCDFDPLTNKLYFLIQNGTNSEIYLVDTATASKTLAATVPQKITEISFAGGNYVGINQIGTEIPAEFKLMQNFPNPFNPVTKIKFSMSKTEFVNITVYDMLGRVVTVLVNEKLSPGNYDVDWNAADYTSGFYFYKIKAGFYSETKKMVLIK